MAGLGRYVLSAIESGSPRDQGSILSCPVSAGEPRDGPGHAKADPRIAYDYSAVVPRRRPLAAHHAAQGRSAALAQLIDAPPFNRANWGIYVVDDRGRSCTSATPIASRARSNTKRSSRRRQPCCSRRTIA